MRQKRQGISLRSLSLSLPRSLFLKINVIYLTIIHLFKLNPHFVDKYLPDKYIAFFTLVFSCAIILFSQLETYQILETWIRSCVCILLFHIMILYVLNKHLLIVRK